MSYSSFFGSFDPKTGYVPHFPFAHLPDIAARAREILSWRPLDQIIHVAETIDWMVGDYFDSCRSEAIQAVAAQGDWQLGNRTYTVRSLADAESLLDEWPFEAVDVKPHFLNQDNTTATAALKACIDGFDVSNDPACPSATEAVYFAVRALWKLSEVIQLLVPPAERQYSSAEAAAFMATLPSYLTELQPEIRLSIAGSYAIEAMDAVCWAEGLWIANAFRFMTDGLRRELTDAAKSTEALAEEIVKRRRSVAASKAAIASHAEDHQMMATVFEWCPKHLHEYTSYDRAAEAIAGQGKGKLVPVAFTTARRWIGKWAKSQDSLLAKH